MKYTIIFCAFSVLLLIRCKTVTSYYTINGTPALIENRSILIGQINGLSQHRSEQNFNTLNNQLANHFKKITYLPANEYLLAKENLNQAELKIIESDLDARKKMLDITNCHYYFKVGIQGFNEEETLLRESISYKFDIFDPYQPSPISSFVIVVKYKKPGFYGNLNGYRYIDVSDPEKEKAGFRRASKEIVKELVQLK